MDWAKWFPGGFVQKTNLPPAAQPPALNQQAIVNLLNFVRRTFIKLIQAAWFLPKTISNAVKQRKQRMIMKEFQAERLDRIRNPRKYLGK